ncbi:MAG: NTP transferase domain-containing protein [Candidatus Binatia bacterium]
MGNNEQPREDISAIVLAGGKSSRMGRPKALLLFDGEPLIVHVVRRLRRLFADILIVAAPGQELPPLRHSSGQALPVTLVRDEVAYQGPVGGIYYGLRAASGEVGFVTSCDVPLLNLSLISYLTSQISDYDVVVPYWQERFQPLHAAYRRSVVSLLEEQLKHGELRPIYLYKKVRTLEVREDEVRRFDPDGLSFLAMNTPEDYHAALTRWQELHRQRTADGRRPTTVGGPRSAVGGPFQDRPVTCTVELFSVARLVAKTSKVSLELPQEATLSHVFFALAERLPTLVGPVITPDRKSLTSGNACNINGRDFVRDPGVKVNPGDSIFIISSDAGG